MPPRPVKGSVQFLFPAMEDACKRPPVMSPPVIEFRNVTKTYRIQQRATPRIGAWLIDKLFEHLQRVPFNALDDVSFTVEQGEFLGLLGTNGAGKSTTLSLIAGVTHPTKGSVRVRGRVASLLQLGIGFHPDLSGMENIFYNGIMLGLTRTEVLDRVGAIIEFSGIADFVYEPVKHYSSGMYARLAMSVALHLDPEIILLDEILAAGDAEFSHRAFARLLELHGSGVTIVSVSHEIMSSRELCDRLIWLDEGKIRHTGDARETVRCYLDHISRLAVPRGHYLHQDLKVSSEPGHPAVADVFMEDDNGERISHLTTGDPVNIVCRIDNPKPLRVWHCLRWSTGRRLMEEYSPVINPDESGRIVYRIDAWPFLRGYFRLSVVLLPADNGEDALPYDRHEDILEIPTKTGEALHLEDVLMSPEVEWSVIRHED